MIQLLNTGDAMSEKSPKQIAIERLMPAPLKEDFEIFSWGVIRTKLMTLEELKKQFPKRESQGGRSSEPESDAARLKQT